MGIYHRSMVVFPLFSCYTRNVNGLEFESTNKLIFCVSVTIINRQTSTIFYRNTATMSLTRLSTTVTCIYFLNAITYFSGFLIILEHLLQDIGWHFLHIQRTSRIKDVISLMESDYTEEGTTKVTFAFLNDVWDVAFAAIATQKPQFRK